MQSVLGCYGYIHYLTYNHIYIIIGIIRLPEMNCSAQIQEDEGTQFFLLIFARYIFSFGTLVFIDVWE